MFLADATACESGVTAEVGVGTGLGATRGACTGVACAELGKRDCTWN